MSLFGLMLRYLRGSWLRAGLTVLAVAASMVAFLLLRTIDAVWTEQVAQTPSNRVVTRHKLGWQRDLPAYYADAIRGIDGVVSAVGLRWAGLKVPAAERVFFDSFAVEGPEFIEMHYELSAPEKQKRSFLNRRQGALVSAELAQEFGWKVGDKVRFVSMFQLEFELIISAIFTSSRYGFARRVIYFHLPYLNESLSPDSRDRISFLAAQIRDPRQGARIAKSIDIRLDGKEDRTFSQEDKAVMAALTGRFGAIMQAVQIIALLVLGVVALILGNTVSMSVRERTQQYGTMRALGFAPRHVMALILGEALVMGMAAGALALVIAYPFLQIVVTRYLEENMSFAPLVVSKTLAATAVGLAAAVAFLAAVMPAYQLSKRNVIDLLRHID
jgi:putative ABC transport system permease protein